MSVQTLAFQVFNISRRATSALGIARPIRTILGPTAGKLMYRLSANTQSPVIVGSHRMYLATKGKYPPIRMAMNEYEQETTELFSDCVETGMSILDIGAHVGYYSLLAAKLAGPTGKVISFEPDPDNYSLLLRNIEENGYTNITAVNQGITSTTGVGTLILSGLDNGRHSIYHHGLPEKGSVSISTTSVDDYFGALGWPTVDLIKMDVEGAELEVLLGMTGLLDRSHNIKLIMELNPVLLKNADVEPKSLLTRIESLGLTLHQVRSGVAPQRLQSSEMGPLIDRLFSSQDSINLYCTKE